MTSRWEAARRALTLARVTGALALFVFAVLAVVVRGPVPGALDLAITRALQSQTWLEAPMRVISIPGNGLIPFALTTLTVILLFAARLRLEAACLTLSAGVGALVNSAIKHAIARPRPSATYVLKLDLVDGFSFPSGHCAFYVGYFGFLAVIVTRRLETTRARALVTALALVPVVTIPFSRMYLGAHWASDTFGALLWSTTWLASVVAIYDGARQPPPTGEAP